jgi:hypothetical protein
MKHRLVFRKKPKKYPLVIWPNDWRSEAFDQMTENFSHLAK